MGLKPTLWHWWQASKADVLAITPRVAPSSAKVTEAQGANIAFPTNQKV